MFAGKTDTNTNHVWFHYREHSDSLAFYDLTIYNRVQTKALLAQLLKIYGKPEFEEIGPLKGTMTVDSTGSAVPWKPGVDYAFREWVNKQTGISYFLSSEGEYDRVTTELIVLKRADKFGQDWIKFLNLDIYEKK